MHPRSGRWLVAIPPPPLSNKITKKDVNSAFLKGMLYAFLIIILLHIGITYVLLY